MTAPVKVFHIIQGLFRGGAARAMIATSKYSRNHANYEHSVASLTPWEPEVLPIVEEAGMRFVPTLDLEVIRRECAAADIVQLEWWNTPQMDAFLRGPLPPMRLLSWFHVAGNRDPQYITRELVDFSDFALASSPQTYECPAIQSLPTAIRLAKSDMAIDGTDFARLANFQAKPHQNFNVGYIGTVDFFKMHPDFVAMSAAAKVPNVKFIVCGGGKEKLLAEQAQALGAAERFTFRGYIEDIRAEIEQFDVYGYPLCEDTYASAELNLQEVMVCGIPPVVFPYGGVGQLVVNNFTGLVVRSAQEYSQAIEYLHQHPDERRRMGENAKRYAEQIFGGENAAKTFHKVYQRMLTAPKRPRIWGVNPYEPVLHQPIRHEDLGLAPKYPGTTRFIESLVDTKHWFEVSFRGDSFEELIGAEEKISGCSTLMRVSGIHQYRAIYPNEPLLRIWHGLACFGAGLYAESISEWATALQQGVDRPHVLWYIAQAACHANQPAVAMESLRRLIGIRPDFSGAQEFLSQLESGAKPSLTTALNQIEFN